MTDPERIVILCRAFYLARGASGFNPKWFKPGHKMWAHFARLLDLLRREKLFGDYRTYLVAQLHYANDPEKVFPQMLYGEKALQKYQWYRERKARRVGEHSRLKMNTQVGTRLTSARVESYFENGAWQLEAFTRRGMIVADVLRGFPGLFHPIFVATAPEVREMLEATPEDRRFSRDVREAFQALTQSPEKLQKLREIYDNCRSKEATRWNGYGSVIAKGGHL